MSIMADTRQATLVLFPIDLADEYPERVLTLTPNSTLVKVGRASKDNTKDLNSGPENAYFDSPIMSREHAKIWIKNLIVYIQDVGSLHGTFLNHKPLTKGVPYTLPHGAVVTFGCRVTRAAETFSARSFRVRYMWQDWKPPAPKTISKSTFCVPDLVSDDDTQEGNMHSELSRPLYFAAAALVSEKKRTLPSERTGSVELVSEKEIKGVSSPGPDQGDLSEDVCCPATICTIEVPESDTSSSQESDSDLEICDASQVSIGNEKVEVEKLDECKSTKSARQEVQVLDVELQELLTEQEIDQLESSQVDGSKENPLVIDESVEARKAELQNHDDEKFEKHPALSVSHVLISQSKPSLGTESPRSDPVGLGADIPTSTLVATSSENPSSENGVSDDQPDLKRELLNNRGRILYAIGYKHSAKRLASPSSLRNVMSSDIRGRSPISRVSGAAVRDRSTTSNANGSDRDVRQQVPVPRFSRYAQQIGNNPATISTSTALGRGHHKDSPTSMMLGPDGVFACPPPCKLSPSDITALLGKRNDDTFGSGLSKSKASTVGSVVDKDNQALQKGSMQQELSDVVGRFDPKEIYLEPSPRSSDAIKEPLQKPKERQKDAMASSSPPGYNRTVFPSLPTMQRSGLIAGHKHPEVGNGQKLKPYPQHPRHRSLVKVHLPSTASSTGSLKRKATDEGPIRSYGDHPSSNDGAHLGLRCEQPSKDRLRPVHLIPTAEQAHTVEVRMIESKKQHEGDNEPAAVTGPPARKKIRTSEPSTRWLDAVKSTAKMAAGAAAAGFGVFAYLAVSNPDPI
ncbi:MAG: hypothetical protein M1816_003174 [Peltula sp. TS41687]|nr:MAG: hypothetical protein M1816_003174 [Peltula sp. TS41687]